MLWASGSVFADRYRITALIGAGATGEVYRATDQATEEPRALKVLRAELAADRESRARFLDTAGLLARIDARGIVRVLDYGSEPGSGLPFVVMPLLEGESLAAIILRRGALGPDELVPICRDLAAGLASLHAGGVVHRDVKPSNVIVLARAPRQPTTDGALGTSAEARAGSTVLASCHAILVDFGIAKLMAVRGRRADTTRNHGTPAYMAPEQMRGEGDIDARADLYSMGHVVFHALAAKPYWETELRRRPNLLRLVRIVAQGPPEPASARAAQLGVSLPASFDAWFERATAPRREQRHASAAEQLAALEEAIARPDRPR
jgi:serine/threonine-protein kinase